MFKKWYWKIRILFLALRWIPQINIGDMVWYEGNKYPVLNGARCGSWRLGYLENGDNGWVSRSDCLKVWAISNMKHSFLAGWHFYMTSWYDIWCREGVKGWMRGCRIWPGKKNSGK